MKMISTRDNSKKELSYCDVLLAGLAPDGGLYVPSEYPQFFRAELETLKSAPYLDIAYSVKKKLIGGDISDTELRQMIERAYSAASFGAAEGGNIVPLVKVEDDFYVQQ